MQSAAKRFAAPELRAALPERPTHFLLALSDAATRQSTDVSRMEAFQDAVRQATAITRPEIKAREACEDDVLRKLRAGQLSAFGFEPPRRTTTPAVRVPAEAWHGFVRWDRGTVEYRGLRFVEVGVMPASWEPVLLRRWTDAVAPAAPVPSRGPKGAQRQIAEAYDALRAADRIRFGDSMRSHFPQIRQWLSVRYPDLAVTDDKPSDESIRKAIKPLFARDRAALTGDGRA